MKQELEQLEKLLAHPDVPKGIWIEIDGDVQVKDSNTATCSAIDVVYTYPNEGGGAYSKKVAQYIAALDPTFVRKLLDRIYELESLVAGK